MKFYGTIGFWMKSKEVSPGIYKPEIIERSYTGDVSWANRHYQGSEYQNENLRLNNQISILSDLYAQQNFASIRYVVWNGVKWRVTNVEMNYPRLVLTIGSVYNGSGEEEAGFTQVPL